MPGERAYQDDERHADERIDPPKASQRNHIDDGLLYREAIKINPIAVICTAKPSSAWVEKAEPDRRVRGQWPGNKIPARDIS